MASAAPLQQPTTCRTFTGQRQRQQAGTVRRPFAGGCMVAVASAAIGSAGSPVHGPQSAPAHALRSTSTLPRLFHALKFRCTSSLPTSACSCHRVTLHTLSHSLLLKGRVCSGHRVTRDPAAAAYCARGCWSQRHGALSEGRRLCSICLGVGRHVREERTSAAANSQRSLRAGSWCRTSYSPNRTLQPPYRSTRTKARVFDEDRKLDDIQPEDGSQHKDAKNEAAYSVAEGKADTPAPPQVSTRPSPSPSPGDHSGSPPLSAFPSLHATGEQEADGLGKPQDPKAPLRAERSRGVTLSSAFFQSQKGRAPPLPPQVPSTLPEVSYLESNPAPAELGLPRESGEGLSGTGEGALTPVQWEGDEFPAFQETRAAPDLNRALRQLQSALDSDDLGSALGKLKGLNGPVTDAVLDSPGGGRAGKELGIFQERAAGILDLALQESDLEKVAETYDWLGQVGVLKSFGKEKAALVEAQPRLVTPDTLRAMTGVEASKLSPKRWGTTNSLAPLAAIGLFSALVNNGVDVRPLAVLLLVLAVADSVYLGGAAQAQLLSLWPGFRRRVLVHEAGHVLAAYLLGCPVRGVILDAFTAMDMGIQGQAGTQFWDSTLDLELKSGRLLGSSVDRYSVVLFAGIAAEALVYGEAEGGESDENLFKALVGSLEPQWAPAKVSNQARWAVLQAYSLLRRHRRALEAVVQSLEQRKPLSDLALAMEAAL